jgi:hypothetical protein
VAPRDQFPDPIEPWIAVLPKDRGQSPFGRDTVEQIDVRFDRLNVDVDVLDIFLFVRIGEILSPSSGLLRQVFGCDITVCFGQNTVVNSHNVAFLIPAEEPMVRDVVLVTEKQQATLRQRRNELASVDLDQSSRYAQSIEPWFERLPNSFEGL